MLTKFFLPLFVSALFCTGLSAQPQFSPLDSPVVQPKNGLHHHYNNCAVAFSADGSRMVMGAYLNDTVYTYHWQNGTWKPLETVLKGAKRDDYGFALALSADGQRLAVGAPGQSNQVRLYEWVSNDWVPMGTPITAPEQIKDIFFGGVLALSPNGQYLAVALPYQYVRSYAHRATNYHSLLIVYHWTGSNWVEHSRISESHLYHSRRCLSFSTDGQRLAIGDQLYTDASLLEGNEQAHQAGKVQVYEWQIDRWNPIGPAIQGQHNKHHLGSSVALSADGNRLAVGAYGDGGPEGSVDVKDPQTKMGQVQLYAYKSGHWTPLGKPIEGKKHYDELGVSVSLSAKGDRVAVNAFNRDKEGSKAGYAQVHEWNGQAWQPMGTPLDAYDTSHCRGYVVALSASGNRVSVAVERHHRKPGFVQTYGICNTNQTIEHMACESSTWPLNGQTYTQDTTVVHVAGQTTLGCDSTVTLELTILKPTTLYITTSQPYLWRGQRYTHSGTYTVLESAASSCELLHTLHLDIVPPLSTRPLATLATPSSIANPTSVSPLPIPSPTTKETPPFVTPASSNNQFRLQPNPAQNQTTLVLYQALESNAQVFLHQLNGSLLAEYQLPKGQTQLHLPVKNLPVGVYLVQLVHPQGQSTQKLVVE